MVEREYIELGMPFFGKRQSLKLLFGDKAYEDFAYEDVSDLICLPVERIDSLAAEQKQWSGNAEAEKAFLEICNQELIFDVVLSQH